MLYSEKRQGNDFKSINAKAVRECNLRCKSNIWRATTGRASKRVPTVDKHLPVLRLHMPAKQPPGSFRAPT
eukprot:3802434-Amphidinium_carterae.1